jgi:hypothetical protein
VTAELEKMRSLRKTAFWFKKYLKTKSIRDTVDDFGQRLSDLRADLTVGLIAAIQTPKLH